MSQLVKFFKEKKMDLKFNKLGKGQQLNDSSDNKLVSADASTSGMRNSSVADEVARAALSRNSNQNVKVNKAQNTIAFEREKLRRELSEAESLKDRFSQKIIEVEKPTALVKVLFWCPKLFGDAHIGSRENIEQQIQQYLQSESELNLDEAAALILIRGVEQSKLPTDLNVSVAELPSIGELRDKRRRNIIKILDNLISQPDNAAYRRLRMGNAFVKDLLSIDGFELFLKACKFTKQDIPVAKPDKSTNYPNEDAPSVYEDPTNVESYYIISEEYSRDTEHLEKLMNLFVSGEAILPVLYRDTKASGATSLILSREQLSDEYFYQTKDELKRSVSQQQRIIEESGMLLTKAMRERLKLQDMRSYRFALIRVRLPDNLILQGTFYANDQIRFVRQWISDCLDDQSMMYNLFAPPSLQTSARTNTAPTARVELNDDLARLNELGLAPSTLLNLVFADGTEIKNSNSILKSSIMLRVENL